MKLRDANPQIYKKLFGTSSFMYYPFICSVRIAITSFKEALKVCEHNFFQEM